MEDLTDLNRWFEKHGIEFKIEGGVLEIKSDDVRVVGLFPINLVYKEDTIKVPPSIRSVCFDVVEVHEGVMISI